MDKIWLWGCGQSWVIRLESLNNLIDEYNKYRLYRCVGWWGWLSEQIHIDVVGYDFVSNKGNEAMTRIHTIME